MQAARPRRISVVVFDKDGVEVARAVSDTGQLTIGRISANDLVLAHPKLSRHHARIIDDGLTGAVVVDLKSSNGTHYQGHRIVGPQVLLPIDRFAISEFRVEVSTEGAELPSLPPAALTGDVRIIGAAHARDGTLIVRASSTHAELTIGNVVGNDLVIPIDGVADRHARVILRDQSLILVDLRSGGDTRVNGKLLTSPRALRPDDKIEVGGVTVAVSTTSVAAAQAWVDEQGQHTWLCAVHQRGRLVGRARFAQRAVTIGRHESNEIVLRDANISRGQARVTVVDGVVTLEHLGERNPTRVNGVVFSGERVIDDSDVVDIGAYQLRFAIKAGEPREITNRIAVGTPAVRPDPPPPASPAKSAKSAASKLVVVDDDADFVAPARVERTEEEGDG